MLLRLIPLVIAIAALVLFFKVLRPRVKDERYRRWEAEGLLPSQLDPEGHRRQLDLDAQREDEDQRRED